MRVFVAVDIKNPQTVSSVAMIRDSLLSTGAPLKPVETENLHITLVFIGEIGEDEAYRLKEELSKIRFKPFTINLHGLGAFPNASRPRVVWIGVDKGSENLESLQKKTLEALRRAGVRYKADHKGFVPHLTIARVKGQRNVKSLSKLIESYSSYDFGLERIEELKLKQSILTPRGPIYKDVAIIKSEG